MRFSSALRASLRVLKTYLFATDRCVELGGYLPSAAQLVGAASRVKLSSTIGDSQLTASIDLDPSDGLEIAARCRRR